MNNLLQNEETTFLTLTEAKNVIEAVNRGQKMAIFAVDEHGNATERLSEINSRVFLNSDKYDGLLGPALAYIRENFNKDIKLSRLADLCEISEGYFSRLFTRQTGKNLTAYITELRLSQACKLLTATRRSVVSIACEVGYVDCGYFYKLFKRKYGCTPLEYRRISF